MKFSNHLDFRLIGGLRLRIWGFDDFFKKGRDALEDHSNVLIIDDLLATGGTALAAIELISKFKNKNIVGAGFIINLPELKGDQKLISIGIKIHTLMEF